MLKGKSMGQNRPHAGARLKVEGACKIDANEICTLAVDRTECLKDLKAACKWKIVHGKKPSD